MRWATLILIPVLVLSGIATVAAEQDALNVLMTAGSLKCVYERGAVGDWKDGQLKTKLSPGDLPPALFDAIDLKNGTARLLSNVGSADVIALPSAKGISFLEPTPSGNSNLTTVFAYYSASGDFIAVTSRHILFDDGPLVSQYHGTCKAPPWGLF